MTRPPQNAPNNTVLLIAYHFPPHAGSSGSLRTEKYSRYLPEFGWRPVILTTPSHAYEFVEKDGQKRIPPGLDVVRGFALDTKRHLGFRGRYLDWMALPDRWITWLLGAVPAGLRAIRKHKVQVLYSTHPIPTAVLIGYVLHRITGLPWVLDIRDPITEPNFPEDPFTRRIWAWIEKKGVEHASRIIFTAPASRDMYLQRFPKLQPGHCRVITNGYDEEDFEALRLRNSQPMPSDKPIRLLHSGLLLPVERNPVPFFKALARLKREGKISSSSLKIALRSPGAEQFCQQHIQENQIEDLVDILPAISHMDALQECADSDGLLLFQAAACNHQIPAKAYEYARVQRPIFALTSPAGNTAGLLREIGGATIANLADEEEIYRALPEFLSAVRNAGHPLPDLEKVRRYARRNQAGQLADCLSELCRQTSVVMEGKAETAVR